MVIIDRHCKDTFVAAATELRVCIPFGWENILASGDEEVIMGREFMKHGSRAKLRPILNWLNDFVVECDNVMTQLGLKPVGPYHEAKKLGDEGEEVLASMVHCVYIFKKIPHAATKKSAAALHREFKSTTKGQRVPESVGKLLTKALGAVG